MHGSDELPKRFTCDVSNIFKLITETASVTENKENGGVKSQKGATTFCEERVATLEG
jgi:hypothetical protein